MKEFNSITTKLFHAKNIPFRKNLKQLVCTAICENKYHIYRRWMSCDGPGYEHMDEQGIVALITGDNNKEADEAVDDEICVPAF